MLFQIRYPVHPLSFKNHQAMHLIPLVFLSALEGLSACSGLRQQDSTPQPEVRHVTADEIAMAMQQDHFSSDYNPYSLIVQGIVTGVRTRIRITSSNCRLRSIPGPGAILVSMRLVSKTGENIEVLSPNAHLAQRQPNAVLLVDCSLP